MKKILYKMYDLALISRVVFTIECNLIKKLDII